MNRKFRLLKDLPGLDSGAIIVQDGENYIVNKDTPNEHYFNKRIVENTPEWFEEVVDKKKIRLFGIPGNKGLNNISKYLNNWEGLFLHCDLHEEEIKIMEAALNGELIDKKELLSTIKALHMPGY